MPNIAITRPVETIDDAATGQKLRMMREAAKLTLREVANEVGISQSYLSDLEVGRRNWSEARAAEVAAAITALAK